MNIRELTPVRWHEIDAAKTIFHTCFIAKGIVDAHGGRIWAENEPGRGMAVHFTVPVHRTGEEPCPRQQSAGKRQPA